MFALPWNSIKFWNQDRYNSAGSPQRIGVRPLLLAICNYLLLKLVQHVNGNLSAGVVRLEVEYHVFVRNEVE